jgi:ABC-type lipoprotein export system ATPase subunit
VKTVLLFKQAVLNSDQPDVRIEIDALQIDEGDAVCLEATADQGGLVFDAAQGLSTCLEGNITFLDQDWTSASNDKGNKLRSQMGRTFPQKGWISNLSIAENIFLSQLYAGKRSIKELEKEAREICTDLGLKDIPRDRPSFAQPDVLLKAQWIRCLLGEKDIILLEPPPGVVSESDAAMFYAAVKKKRSEGTAVFWTGSKKQAANNDFLHPSRQYRIREQRVEEVS